MHNSSPSFAVKAYIRIFLLAIMVLLSGAFSSTLAVNSKAPTLISHIQDAITNPTGTRAVAFESVTMKAEPFPVTSTVQYSPDTRTRICVFALGLDLLQGEGVNAFSADMQDSAGKLYAMRVEFMGQVPNFPGITMFILRLPDDIGDAGDVLLRLNLHGMGSNRVRVAIGHSGGGPTDDVGAVATPAPATPPPADPPFVPDSYNGPVNSDADAIRFLEQTTWGPTAADITHVKAVGFRAYLNEQFSAPVANLPKGSNYPDLFFPNNDQATACPTSSPGDPNYNQAVCNRDNFTMYPVQRTFFTNAFYGQDQLRQRVAFALHQILVVSGSGELNRPSWLTIYLQSLDRNAFGNYRTLLQEITLTPAMGEYLDMNKSRAFDPNENFAREILQLFSIGTEVLNLDGTPQRDGQGVPIASYSQADVNEFTEVFTGWNLVPGTIAPGTSNWRDPMIPRFSNSTAQHDTTTKNLFGTALPGCSGALGVANQICATNELNTAINVIFNHPNVGPFLSKQLIQHLVTSNPSPAYVERVARVFNNDCDALYQQGCTSARGNFRAVVQAILLDPEARGDVKSDPNYGKLREPAQYIAGFLRAFKVKGFGGNATSDGVLGGRSSTDFTGTLDQPIFQPTTVFSYYQPGYEVPGAKILGPAFGILSTSTTLRRANDINTLIYSGVSTTTTPTLTSPDRPLGTSIDIANLEALAANPGDFQVTSYLNNLLFHGTMSTQVRDAIIGAMNAINDANLTTRHQKRARAAVYLAATAPQYDIQR